MRFDFDIYEQMRRELPVHKRQPRRMALFFWPLKELKALWEGFVDWRKEMIYESNITGQTLSLAHLLNKRVANANNSIRILNSADGAKYLGLIAEDTEYMELSLLSEASDFAEIPLNGEAAAALTVDFQIIIPPAANPDEVHAIMEDYVIAGMEYEIINS